MTDKETDEQADPTDKIITGSKGGQYIETDDGRLAVPLVDAEGERLSEEETKANWQAAFERLVADGIIVPDQDAPPCMGCQAKLEEITVTTIWILGEEAPIETSTFKWVPGMHQFNVAPSFYGFVKDEMARFEAVCTKCGAPVMDLVIVEQPHGLKFGEVSRMAGNL